MAGPICFASGNLWRWGKNKNRNEHINILRKLDIEGVEITTGFKEELFSLKLSKTNVKWLRSLKHVSIHAPFGLVYRSESHKDLINQMNALSRLYKQINAKNVVIHPYDLPSLKILNKYKMKISTENMVPHNHITHADLKYILKKAPKMRLCLDAAHAYLYSKKETASLIRKFKKKISQVHMSGTYMHQEHVSMRKVTKDFLRSIEPIKKLNVPIVIEEDIKRKNIGFVKNEIKRVKEIFEKE